MKNCLIDVTNDRGTVLHVFPIAMEGEDGTSKVADPEHEALRLAALMQLVPETEVDALHAKPHVARGGQLAPYSDALETKRQQLERIERRIRERAYFLWQQAGCPEHQADELWRKASQFEGNNGSL